MPSSWRYLSGLGLHQDREKLIALGWSVLNRYSRALQARDEIGRLFYLPKTPNSEDQMAYHFDYLTLLLTATFDALALITNDVYGLGLKHRECGLRRKSFRKAVQNRTTTDNLGTILATNATYIDILFDLRNKIHSVSLETDFNVPDKYPDELLERIYQFDPKDHWGIQKQNVTVTVNGGDPVPSIEYSVDLYNLAHGLVDEATKLINSLMEGTKIEDYLVAENLSNILVKPPADMIPFIETYMLLA